MDLAVHFLDNARREFGGLKKLADRAMAQVADEGFFAVPAPGSNSIAIDVKHVAGNLRSRWTDFLTTDGEKPDRDRDAEFVILPEDTRTSLLERWEAGWSTLYAALEPLGAADLLRQVRIRNEPHTVVQAVQRQLTHYGYHVGQIVFLSKYWRQEQWNTLSVPRNRSVEFNARMQEQQRGK
jgi:hypothetical protein